MPVVSLFCLAVIASNSPESSPAVEPGTSPAVEPGTNSAVESSSNPAAEPSTESKAEPTASVPVASVVPTKSPANAIERIVVLPFKVGGDIDPKKGTVLDELLVTELSQVVPTDIKVMGLADITDLLDLEQQKMLMGCDDNSCLAELGNAMGASHLWRATLGKIGDKYVVNAKLINARTTGIAYRKALYLGTTESELISAVRSLAQDFAAVQGWRGAVAEEQGFPVLLASGIGAGAVGALALLGCGVGLVVADSAAAQDQVWAERESASQVGLGLIGGTAVGAVLAAGGVALVAVSLLEE